MLWGCDELVDQAFQSQEHTAESASYGSGEAGSTEEVNPSEEGEVVDFKELIKTAMQAKIAAGKGGFYDKGTLKKRPSKRQKTREFWANNPDVKPWPLRPRLFGKHEITRRNG